MVRTCIFSRSHTSLRHFIALRANLFASSLDTIAGPQGDFAIPSLDELGLPKGTTSIRGGETEALRRLEHWLKDKKAVATFRKPQTSPAEFDPPSTTQLSPYLKFGCLSVNEFLWRTRDTVDEWKQEGGKNVSKGNCPLLRSEFHKLIHATVRTREHGGPT
jgi:deoxyribodipyrimidine photolyase